MASLPSIDLARLDFAITEFREMKMQPAPERVLRRKEILGYSTWPGQTRQALYETDASG